MNDANYNYMLDLTEGYYLENKETKILTRIMGRDHDRNYVLFTANDLVGGMHTRDHYTPVEMIRLLKKHDHNVLHITSEHIHMVAKIPYLRIGEVCKAVNNVKGTLLSSRKDCK